jgi:hypothetical protein
VKKKNPARLKFIRAIIAHLYWGLFCGLLYVLSRIFEIYPSTIVNLIRPEGYKLVYPREEPTAETFLSIMFFMSVFSIAGMFWNQREAQKTS